MNHFFIYVALVCLSMQTVTNSMQTSNVSNEKPLNQNTELNNFKTTVACNKTSLEANFHFREPFYGVIYANQIFSTTASQCKSYGNGSKEIHFHTKTNECGVATIENQSNYNEYEMVLYVQNDRNIQQASDEKIDVKCAPQELLLRGVVGNKQILQTSQTSKFNGKSLYGGSNIQVRRMLSHDFTLTHVSDALECRMEVMKGRIPFLKPIEGFVDLGQDVTVMIKIKEIDGIDSMVSRCYAHEGSHAVKQELTNSDGCSIDRNILPNFQLMPNQPLDSKVYYTTFPAFKFPDKTNLNIQCTVIICNTTCPQIRCDRDLSPALRRVKRLSISPTVNRTIIMEKKSTPKTAMTSMTWSQNNDSKTYDSLLLGIGTSDSKAVKNGPNIDTQINTTFTANTTISSIHQIYINRLGAQCLSSQYVLTFGFVLIFGLLCALTIACYYGIKVQVHKLKNVSKVKSLNYGIRRPNANPCSYGPVTDLTI